LLDGRDEVTPADLRWLEHVLWGDPEERPKVAAAIGTVATGYLDEGRKLLVQAEEVHAYARRAWPDAETRDRAVLEAHTKLQEISKRLGAMLRAAEERDRDTSSLERIAAQVAALQRALLAE
jgi:hypothetical protein